MDVTGGYCRFTYATSTGAFTTNYGFAVSSAGVYTATLSDGLPTMGTSGAGSIHGHTANTGSVASTAASMTGSNTVTGTFGLVTGGQNGNSPFSASGNNTPSGSITGTATAAAQAFTGTQGNNEPAYVEVVWVIRVK